MHEGGIGEKQDTMKFQALYECGACTSFMLKISEGTEKRVHLKRKVKEI